MDKDATGHRFLVVEDEMMVLLMIEGMLADFGCEVAASAATAQQALELIATRCFDGALLDMNLNGERSDAVARALEAHGVPFIFCTGGDMEDVAPQFRDHPFLRKPFSYDDLAEKLAHLHLEAL
jgi:CheY-like chemotaxis protein